MVDLLICLPWGEIGEDKETKHKEHASEGRMHVPSNRKDMIVVMGTDHHLQSSHNARGSTANQIICTHVTHTHTRVIAARAHICQQTHGMQDGTIVVCSALRCQRGRMYRSYRTHRP